MKLLIFSFLVAFLFACAQAAVTMKTVIVTFPDETPGHIMQQAKDAIIEAGGRITHEYRMIKGFSAVTPDKGVKTISTLSTEFPAIIEEDQLVSIDV